MGDDASGDNDKGRRSYFLQACFMFFSALLIFGGWGTEFNELDGINVCPDATSDTAKKSCAGYALMITGATFIMIGAGLAILLYCCKDKVPGWLHWILTILLVLGGLFVCAGAGAIADATGNLASSLTLYSLAWAFYLFLLTIVVGLSVSSKLLSDEDQGKAELKRVTAQAIALMLFGLFLLPYYGELGVDVIEFLPDANKVELASAVFCFLFSIVVIVCFCICKEGTEEGGPNRVIRIVLAALILFAGICYFGARAKITDLNASGFNPNQSSTLDIAINIKNITPGFVVILGAIGLAIDIAF